MGVSKTGKLGLKFKQTGIKSKLYALSVYSSMLSKFINEPTVSFGCRTVKTTVKKFSYF